MSATRETKTVPPPNDPAMSKAAARPAEEEVLEIKAALEKQTDELAHSMALMRATLEATSDGILVTSADGTVTDFNRKFIDLWRVPSAILERQVYGELRGFIAQQIDEPEKFLARIKAIYETAPNETNDLFSCADGRLIEGRSNVQLVSGEIVGRVWSFRDVTDRIQSEITARRLAAIVDSSDDAIVGKDLNLRITSWNKGAERIFGYTAEEMVGSSILRIVPPDRHDEEESIRQRITAGIRVPPMETVRVGKGGRLIDISVTISPIKDSTGRVIGASKVARDITDRKRNEQARRASEARNAAVLQTALDSIVMINEESMVLDWNPAAERTFGFSRKEAIGRMLHELIIPPHLRMKHLGMGPLLNRRVEVPARHADGREMLVEAAVTAIRGEGSPLYAIYLRDLTEQRRNQQALAESHALLRAVIESTNDAVFVKDKDGRYLLINPAGARFMGASAADVIGKKDEDFFPAKAAASTVAADRAVMDNDASDTYEDTHDVEGERRTFLSTKGPFRDRNGKIVGVVGISRDITERKRNEDALKVAKNEAEGANRAKSEFLSRMSHELRTPLNAILGFGQLLETDDLTPDQKESAGLIVSAGRHLLDLINDVLDISRIDADRLDLSVEAVGLKDAVDEAVALVGPLAARTHVRLDNHLADDLGLHVMADKQRLKQVLLNLLSNAIKYNRVQGEVRLTATIMYDESGTECVRLAITDTGLGMSSKSIERLFTPFDRLGAERTEVEGVGLGLVLTKRLVELMGAKITVESEPNVGSTFAVTFLRASDPGQLVRMNGDDETTAPGETRQRVILYIEDNLSNLKLVERVLARRAGAKLIAAMQGGLGIDLAREHQPDLILLDLHLPDISGREVLARLQAHEQTRHVPVIVVSADATEEQITRVRAAGARTYLTKPIDVRLFNQAIDDALAEKDAAQEAADQ